MGAAAQQGRLSGAAGATARDYAARLLGTLGVHVTRPLELDDEHPALAWARSGLMALTGARDGAARMCPVPLAACADGALAALAALAPPGAFAGLRGSQLLAERAAITGATRAGAVSPGGSCRLLDAADGTLALNLARDGDWTLLPAWLERDDVADWPGVARAVRTRAARELVERGRDMGLAVALDEMGAPPSSWVSFAGASCGRDAVGPAGPSNRPPLVVDLSSLWAGPLCGDLLRRAGACVIKVESRARPDGARHGPRAFFDLLNAGKASVALDFSDARDRARLRELLLAADIVIEGSRPRALRQLGCGAEELLAANPRLTWLSITGHGRAEPHAQWIGYGDDAGVAAGLSAVMRDATGEALVVGDAIADPLTGLHAALAAWVAHRGGGGRLVCVSLRQVVAHLIADTRPAGGWRARQRDWERVVAGRPVAPPRARAPLAVARALGADTGIIGADNRQTTGAARASGGLR